MLTARAGQTVRIFAGNGGAAVVEFKVDVPGTYLLVDHSIYRIDKGAVGGLKVEGAGGQGIFESVPGGK